MGTEKGTNTRPAYVAAHTPDASVYTFTEPDAATSSSSPDLADYDREQTNEGRRKISGSNSISKSGDSKRKGFFLRLKAVIQANTGLLLVAASQAFFSAANVAVKELNGLDRPVPTLELVLVRMSITWLCCVSYMMWAKVPHPFAGPEGVRFLLVLRGFSGFFGLFGTYYSLKYLSLSDATVITFLAPMWTGVVGALVLKEKFGWKEAGAGLCCMFGVVLIARPPFLFGSGLSSVTEEDELGSVTSSQRLVAVGVALLGVVGSTCAYTTLRAIGKRAHPLHALTSFSSQCVLASIVGMIVMRVPVVVPTRLEWVAMLIMIGLFGFIAQVLLTLGLQRETAGRGTLAVYLQIVFATIFERIFFQPEVSVLSTIGTVIIVVSAVYVAMSKKQTEGNVGEATGSDVGSGLEEGLLSGAAEEGDEMEMKENASHDRKRTSVP